MRRRSSRRSARSFVGPDIARDLSAVAVSIGPGSFTGLRVGVVCAKTLAYATGCRLAAVDTLRAIAANSPADVVRVHVLADALRGDAYVASYERIDGSWTAQVPPALAVAAAWLDERRPGDVISGPGLAVYAANVPPACRQLPADCWTPRPHRRPIGVRAAGPRAGGRLCHSRPVLSPPQCGRGAKDAGRVRLASCPAAAPL